MDRRVLAVLVALPGVALAGAGLFHPHHLDYDTAQRWWTLHVPGLLVFPLIGAALAVVVRGRRDPVAWVVRVLAYVYATFYSALDVVNGIAAGYVTRQLGPDVPRPEAVSQMFAIGSPLGEVGSIALIGCCVALAFDQGVRHGPRSLGGLLLLPGAWLVHVDHIFSPEGVVGCLLLAAGTAALVLAQPVAAVGNPTPRAVTTG